MIKRKESGRPSKRPNDAELSMLYERMTAAELAKHYQVSVYTVRNWIYKSRHKERSGAV